MHLDLKRRRDTNKDKGSPQTETPSPKANMANETIASVPAEAAASREAQQQEASSLIEEARYLCTAEQWTAAFDTFRRALELCRHDRAVAAAVSHNMGRCLQSLGEFEAAKGYYEEALSGLCALRPSGSAVVTDAHNSRITFVKQRLLEVTLHRRPAPEYLDQWGRKRPTIIPMPEAVTARRLLHASCSQPAADPAPGSP